MEVHKAKLITIVAEAALEARLLASLRDAGCSGYTCTAARGAGSRGVRLSEAAGRNVRIETVVSESVAETILRVLERKYFDDYAVIAYAEDVSVVRGDKYL